MSEEVKPNIINTIPFFWVFNMAASLQFYKDGMGFEMTNYWMPRGTIEWCCLKRGGGLLMLQEIREERHDEWRAKGKLGVGVSISFTCEDALALYNEFTGRGLTVSEPFVGNSMWVITLTDPDGYRVEFQSFTDVREETTYSEWKK